MNQPDLQSLLSRLPHAPGIYKFKNEQGELLYVGKAKDLANRVRSYFQKQNNRPVRTVKLVEQIRDVEWIEVGSDLEALILESNLIKEFHPKYNILLKDDKNFVYIKITKTEAYPRIMVVRRVDKDGSRYFGPKTAAGKVKKTLGLLQKLFMYRSCDLGIEWQNEKATVTKKTMAYPCLDYHIKRCAAPCLSLIDPSDYLNSIQKIEQFLEGKTEEIVEELKTEMQNCVQNKSFEKAALLRDKLLAIEELQGKQIVSDPSQQEADVWNFVLHDGKAYFNLFMVRQGKLINQENLIVEAEGYQSGDEAQAPEVLESTLFQYYEHASDLPNQIFLPFSLPEQNFFDSWLSQKISTKLRIQIPQRGKKHELLELAAKNAESFFKQHQARWAGFNTEEEGVKTKEALDELGRVLELAKAPKRIECYDISHLGGSDTVASMVVFENGRPKNSDYRHFRLRTLAEGEIDDFKSMEEILDRRLKRLQPVPLPFQIKKGSKKRADHIAQLREEWHGDREIRGDLKEYYLAYDSETPVGLVWLTPGEKGQLLLRSLYVSPEYRQRGVASALLHQSIKTLKPKRIYLTCFDENLSFYEGLGFEAIKHFPQAFAELYLDALREKHPNETIHFLAYDCKKHSDISFESKPDLIVIDGGKGQLSSALASRDKYGLSIPMIGLAKREEEIFRPNQSLPLLLPAESGALHILQNLRNEAHRFAIGFQRDSRAAHLTASILDKIPGLGEKTKLKLLKHFGSLDGLKAATVEEIEKVVGKSLQERICLALSNE